MAVRTPEQRARDKAVELLLHYFTLAIEGAPYTLLSADSRVEIADIVDAIIEASKPEGK